VTSVSLRSLNDCLGPSTGYPRWGLFPGQKTEPIGESPERANISGRGQQRFSTPRRRCCCSRRRPDALLLLRAEQLRKKQPKLPHIKILMICESLMILPYGCGTIGTAFLPLERPRSRSSPRPPRRPHGRDRTFPDPLVVRSPHCALWKFHIAQEAFLSRNLGEWQNSKELL
jgi:hypothetical protein